MEITKNIINYIEEQRLSLELVSKETKIPLKKFMNSGKEAFSATELCVVCEYLKVNPEQFYTKKIK